MNIGLYCVWYFETSLAISGDNVSCSSACGSTNQWICVYTICFDSYSSWVCRFLISHRLQKGDVRGEHGWRELVQGKLKCPDPGYCAGRSQQLMTATSTQLNEASRLTVTPVTPPKTRSKSPWYIAKTFMTSEHSYLANPPPSVDHCIASDDGKNLRISNL